MNEIPSHLASSNPKLSILLSNILSSCREISTLLRANKLSSKLAGTQNDFGDHQLEVDLITDEIIFNGLKKSKLVYFGTSEESPSMVDCGGEGYCVAFDPLDGSSIMNCNLTIGTIFGIWEGTNILNLTGRDQKASVMCVYGPKTVVIIALNDIHLSCYELTLIDSNWINTAHTDPNLVNSSVGKLRVKEETTIFAPGNLKACVDNQDYSLLFTYWLRNSYTLRYTGGLVPDIFHIICKQHGVYSSAVSKTAKAKLRLVFECAPIALIMEACGGSTLCAPGDAFPNPISVLDVVISDMDQKIGVCFGSKVEVQRFQQYMFK